MIITLRLLKLLVTRPPNFAGEVIGADDDLCEKLLGCEPPKAIEVDADHNPIGGPVVAQVTADDNKQSNKSDKFTLNEKTDPFITDGISKTASIALHGQGLHTVEDVRAYIAAGNDVNAIEHITDAQAEKIVKLYGTVTEHSDE